MLPRHARDIPILLTSSVIAYDRGVKLLDTEERTRLALESVAQWLRIEPKARLVLCDGSSHDFSGAVRKLFPFAEIECLYFENDQQAVQQRGRGYGEGEIVRYALEHSQLIAQAGCFAKCSSKLWVENFADCASAWQGDLLLQGIFLNVFTPFKSTSLDYIDTRFYIASIQAYQRWFLDAHQKIDVERSYGLENCFMDIVRSAHLRHVLSPVAPVICGVGGGIGKAYKSSFKRRIKERLRLALARMHADYRALFIPRSKPAAR